MEEERGAEEQQGSPPEGNERVSRPPSIRPSLPPSTGPSRSYRILFAAAWIVVQATLVITADRRIDGAFGFRMFSESSTLKVVLYREVDRADGQRSRVRVDGGEWIARDANGSIHRFSWYDRVPRSYWIFDQEMHASYGARTQLARLQSAVDDVAAHLPEDAETRRLLAEVTVRRNGREPVIEQLASRERPGNRLKEKAPPKELTPKPNDADPFDGGP